MSKLIQEMYQILNPNEKIQYQNINPNQPREVAGGFVLRGATLLDTSLLESIGTLTWEQIADVALLSKVNKANLNALSSTYMDEGVSSFRRLYNEMAEGNYVTPVITRGSIVFLNKICEYVEHQPKYIDWCVRTLAEADDSVIDRLIEKDDKYKELTVGNETKDQHDKAVDTANSYLGKQFIEPYEGPDQNKTREKGLDKVKEVEKGMTKTAAKMGKTPDEAFPNAYIDLARERARNS